MTYLRYKGVNDDKTFARTGDTMLRVDFTDDRTNQPVGDWCPGWDEVEAIVVAALSVEKGNKGRMVKAVERINELAASRLPELPIRRLSAIITAYEKPNLDVLNLDSQQQYDERFTLKTPISQSMVDLLVEHRVHSGLLLRGREVIKIIIQIDEGGMRPEEVSASQITVDEIKVQRLGSFVRLARKD